MVKYSHDLEYMPKAEYSGHIKSFKDIEDKRLVYPGEPIIARLDGKNFHSWTRGLDRPFDERLSALMIATTKYLTKETNALVGYTQSDEISLTWNPQGDTEPIYGGKVQKIASILASMCTVFFNRAINISGLSPVVWGKDALFDARVFTVYSESDGARYFKWRVDDAAKNSVSMAASEYFSPNKLHKVNSVDKIKMLDEIGVDWFAYPNHFKNGTFIKRDIVARHFTMDEIEKLPPKHEARTNPDLMVERSEISEKLPPQNFQDWREWIYGV